MRVITETIRVILLGSGIRYSIFKFNIPAEDVDSIVEHDIVSIALDHVDDIGSIGSDVDDKFFFGRNIGVTWTTVRNLDSLLLIAIVEYTLFNIATMSYVAIFSAS